MTHPTRPELVGTRGMVASTHWLASAAGMGALEAGGNAFDAAVTAGFVLQVVEPHLNGPGGEAPILFSRGGSGEVQVLCGQGVAPAAATAARYRDLGLELVPGTGLLAATVPGAWDAWLLLLRDHGTRTLREVLTPALEYARDGFPLISRVSATIGVVEQQMREHWPTSAAQWLPDGVVPAEGTRFRLPALAATWERLIAEAESAGGDREAQIDAGRRAWSHGFVAEAIEVFSRNAVRDDSGSDHAGLLTGADLAAWTATYEQPAVAELDGGWSLAKCGAWSQGPALLQTLQLLRGFDLAYVDGVPTAETVHLATECVKLAMADREAFYGDCGPDGAAGVPLGTLLSRDYADARRTLVGSEASLELRPGLDGVLPAFVTSGVRVEPAGEGTGEPTVGPLGRARGDTVHVDVVDAAGNMVSATPSGGWLQSSPTIPALGFCLGTRAQMFWLEDGLPSTLTPGRRPRTTLTPSMALRDGEPTLAFGTPGGDQQEQWQLSFWLAHTVGGLHLQDAIDAPAWHSTAFPSSFAPRGWTPGGLVVESRVGNPVIADLKERGHAVVDAGPWALGRLSAVSRDPATGLLRAGANPRGAQGYAVGR
jgi:gamma-glutamyltranspeptidase/glutathione hydrolase